MAGHTLSVSVVEKAHGTHRFKIIGYKQNLYNLPIKSGRFNVGGHDWKLLYYQGASHNSIVIECKLTVIHVPDDEPITESFCKIEIPPPEMAQQFGMLLDVGARRPIRSPVFKSQLFGGFMRDKRMQCLQISDMQPSVFKALLTGNRHEMLCHILEVADLYAIERLKTICERMLWMDLDVENVAMTLALTEQQHCKNILQMLA
ncbi:hypothetical protein SETIT_6G077000v2 [Setaria italica]|uniref:BTB domain-containing protein n=1 Tax=Setaria italica TaxID=4555 RepID=A0A368RJ39_SETIT|nr:hypothetical protein SETIT_6G077000v2 [Setaria italica]